MPRGARAASVGPLPHRSHQFLLRSRLDMFALLFNWCWCCAEGDGEGAAGEVAPAPASPAAAPLPLKPYPPPPGVLAHLAGEGHISSSILRSSRTPGRAGEAGRAGGTLHKSKSAGSLLEASLRRLGEAAAAAEAAAVAADAAAHAGLCVEFVDAYMAAVTGGNIQWASAPGVSGMLAEEVELIQEGRVTRGRAAVVRRLERGGWGGGWDGVAAGRCDRRASSGLLGHDAWPNCPSKQHARAEGLSCRYLCAPQGTASSPRAHLSTPLPRPAPAS